MSDDFTPITTQDDFNARITERLNREKAKFERELEKFADYDALKQKAESTDSAVAAARDEERAKFADYDDLKQKVTDFEQASTIAALRSEVATATGVPVEALVGSTKEELEAHAAVLKPLINTGPVVPNPGNTPGEAKPSDELAFVRGLFGGD